MIFLAFLKDSLRETVDKKSFWVLGILSLIFVLFCFSLSFDPLTPEEGLKETVKRFNRVMAGEEGNISVRMFHDLTFEVADIQVLGPEAGHYEDGFSLRLRPERVEPFHDAVRLDAALRAGTMKSAEGEIPKEPNPPPMEEQIRFLRKQFVENGFVYAEVVPAGGDAFRVRCKALLREQVRGGFKMGFLFGAFDTHVAGQSISMMVFAFEYTFAEWVAGFGGVLMALIFTAFFIPGMLEKGNIEILISKPIPRSLLLIYKYLGGLLYVFLLSVVLIGGSWLGLSLRSGYWNATYLWSIGVLTFYFAILYSVSVLFGVLWRSWIGSILMTALAWILFTLVNTAYVLVHSRMFAAQVSPTWKTMANLFYYVLPKTSHLTALNTQMLAKAHLGETVRAAAEQSSSGLPIAVTWELVIFSSLAFIIVMLGLACWRFSRKDY